MKLAQYLERTQQLRSSRPRPEVISRFRGIPFICQYNNSIQCIDRCFNHTIGLPIRDNQPRPIYQWQYDYIIKNLDQYHFNWMLKATGIGLSELVLRYVLWRALSSNEWNQGIIPILCSPNYELAKRLLNRAYDLIYDWFPNSKVNEYKLMVNDTEIAIFPAHNLDSVRSLTNVRFIFLDEADFWSKGEQQQARTIAERYIGKCPGVSILLASTANKPGGLMEQIQKEQDSMYHKTFIPYTIALGTLFTKAEIKQAMKSPSFEQEYNLKYLGGIGNLFNQDDIDFITQDKYTLTDSDTEYYTRYLGCDMGFGSSNFAITIVQVKDNKIEVVYSEEYERPEYETMVSLVHQLMQRYHCCKGYFDSSNPGFISSVKRKYGNSEYQKYWILDPEVVERWIYSDCTENKIVPIVWRTKHIEMLQHLHKLVSTRNIRINPKFVKLITSLKTATSKNDKFDLDKSQTSYNDSLDSLQLAVLPIGFT